MLRFGLGHASSRSFGRCDKKMIHPREFFEEVAHRSLVGNVQGVHTNVISYARFRTLKLLSRTSGDGDRCTRISSSLRAGQPNAGAASDDHDIQPIQFALAHSEKLTRPFLIRSCSTKSLTKKTG